MIQLIEAPPRSGKSYYAVNYLCKFTEYDGLYNEYVLKSDVLIISNIEGLKIRHWKLDECLKKRNIEEFFSITNFESIMEKTGKRHVILAIDECHDYFPAGYVNHDVYSFFAFHGHIGLDIILMTQSLERTSRMFNPLLEYVVKVTPRSRAIFKNFSYRYVDIKGKFLYSKVLKKNPLVFNAYKSFRKDEQNKPKNAVLHWVVITSILLVIGGFSFKGGLSLIKSKSRGAEESAKIAEQRLVYPGVAETSVSDGRDSFSVPGSVTEPVVMSNYSSSVLAARSAVTVVGKIEGGDKRYYLLADGRRLTSKRNLEVGEVW